MENPVYVIFITDGDNDDKPQTEAVMKELSQHGVFIQFVGIGNNDFPFLKRLDDMPGRKIDNANFMEVANFDHEPTDVLYKGLMKEFPTWLQQARSTGMVK